MVGVVIGVLERRPRPKTQKSSSVNEKSAVLA